MRLAAFLALVMAFPATADAAPQERTCRFPSKAFGVYTLNTRWSRTKSASYERGTAASFCGGFDVYVLTGASVTAEDADILIRNLRGIVKFRA
ncbi:MAG TPA: hypothetical protein VNX25_03555, partial [Verrucomicrobiae bacterium]|nr:hypothetical protein [Verrucomicrobiae bacterium]